MGSSGSRPARDGNQVAVEALDAFQRNQVASRLQEEQSHESPTSRTLLVTPTRASPIRSREYGSLIGQPIATAPHTRVNKMHRSSVRPSECCRALCCAHCEPPPPPPPSSELIAPCVECHRQAFGSVSLCPVDCAPCHMLTSGGGGGDEKVIVGSAHARRPHLYGGLVDNYTATHNKQRQQQRRHLIRSSKSKHNRGELASCASEPTRPAGTSLRHSTASEPPISRASSLSSSSCCTTATTTTNSEQSKVSERAELSERTKCRRQLTSGADQLVNKSTDDDNNSLIPAQITATNINKSPVVDCTPAPQSSVATCECDHQQAPIKHAAEAINSGGGEGEKREYLVWNELAARYGRMSRVKSVAESSVASQVSPRPSLHFSSPQDNPRRRRARPSRGSCALHVLLAGLQTVFPIISSLRDYSLPADLISDFAAGFTIAVLHIPQGMAYGLLSGVEPIHGLYVSFIPVLVMSLMSKSRHVSYGTFAVISMLLVNACDNVRTNYTALASSSSSSSSSINATNLPLVIADNHQPPGDQKLLLLKSLLTSNTLDTSSDELAQDGVDATGSGESQVPSSIEILTCVCLVCGLIHITMSLMRLGVLSLMFSDQLVSSFTTASAIHVLTSQLAGLFDLSLAPIHEELFKIARIWWQFGRAILTDGCNQTTALLSLISISFLLLIKQLVEPALRRKFRKLTCLPSELVLMAIVILCSWQFKFQQNYHVKIIGHVPTGLPEAKLPRLELVPYVIKDSLTIALISFAMNLSIAQVYAKKFRYELNANQELFALGSANLVSSFFSCFPCASSLSRSSVQSSLNVRSQLCSLFSCAIVVLIICFFAHILHDLPRSTLSCIIVVALKGILMQVRDLYDNWRLSKLDALVWILTFLSVIIFGVTFGLILGIAASLFMIFLRLLTPNHSILGRLPGTEIFVDTNAFTNCEEFDRIKIFRFNSALCYLNRTMLKSKIEKLLPLASNKSQGFRAICSRFHAPADDSSTTISYLIIDCSALSYCDYSGAATLIELIEDLERDKVSVYLAACPLKLIDMFEKINSTGKVLDENVFPTISDAIGQARYLLTSRLESSADKKMSGSSMAFATAIKKSSSSSSAAAAEASDTKDKSVNRSDSILDVP